MNRRVHIHEWNVSVCVCARANVCLGASCSLAGLRTVKSAGDFPVSAVNAIGLTLMCANCSLRCARAAQCPSLLANLLSCVHAKSLLPLAHTYHRGQIIALCNFIVSISFPRLYNFYIAEFVSNYFLGYVISHCWKAHHRTSDCFRIKLLVM